MSKVDKDPLVVEQTSQIGKADLPPGQPRNNKIDKVNRDKVGHCSFTPILPSSPLLLLNFL